MIFFQEYNQSNVYQNDEYTRILSRDKGYKRHDPCVNVSRNVVNLVELQAIDIIAEKIHDLSDTGLVRGCYVQP